MNFIEKEKLIKADIVSIENRVRHAFNQGYDLGFKDGKKAKPQDIDYKAQYERLSQKAEIVISQLRADRDRLMSLSSVTPQEPQTFKWCTDCREYDQEKHCCHRWSKVIRNTVEEMKQEYIEREVLDKIRAEINEVYEELDGCDPDSFGTFACRIDDILDKYKGESEG